MQGPPQPDRPKSPSGGQGPINAQPRDRAQHPRDAEPAPPTTGPRRRERTESSAQASGYCRIDAAKPAGSSDADGARPAQFVPVNSARANFRHGRQHHRISQRHLKPERADPPPEHVVVSEMQDQCAETADPFQVGAPQSHRRTQAVPAPDPSGQHRARAGSRGVICVAPNRATRPALGWQASIEGRSRARHRVSPAAELHEPIEVIGPGMHVRVGDHHGLVPRRPAAC